MHVSKPQVTEDLEVLGKIDKDGVSSGSCLDESEAMKSEPTLDGRPQGSDYALTSVPIPLWVGYRPLERFWTRSWRLWFGMRKEVTYGIDQLASTRKRQCHIFVSGSPRMPAQGKSDKKAKYEAQRNAERCTNLDFSNTFRGFAFTGRRLSTLFLTSRRVLFSSDSACSISRLTAVEAVTVNRAARAAALSTVVSVTINGEQWWLKLGPNRNARQAQMVLMSSKWPWEFWFQELAAFPVEVKGIDRPPMLIRDAGFALEERPPFTTANGEQLYATLVRVFNAHGICHNDIALRNICCKNGVYHLIDWGMACRPGLDPLREL
ncbi:hypothetical protein SELMODRAFT_422588 [Selaginella moellendorffii]|uniref:Protein kinase domain-containing protein n=1 Tax=Selaginella moellendorffii TaxID=88036 RepID=D8SIX2_SELML|nr:hypothetical protein SELMODRAFT_422588 [Selaginella moellendorffii]